MTTTQNLPATQAAPQPASRPARRSRVLDVALDNIVWILLIVFALLADVLNPFFLTVPNLQNVLGIIGSPVPSEFMLMLPYVVTIFAVAGLVGRSRPPAADGVAYQKE